MGNHLMHARDAGEHDGEHTDVADLVPAYALWAVTDEERARVEAHLLTCDRCRGEVFALRTVAHQLPLLVDDREPPARLRTRLLSAALAAEAPGAPSAARRPPLLARLPRLPRQPAALAASVLLAFSLGLGAWNVALQARLAEQEARLAQLQAPRVLIFDARGTPAAPGVSGQVVYLVQQGTAFLTVEQLPAAPAGRAYQVWLIQDGRPIDAGLLATSPNQATARLDADLGRYQAIAVSLEPAGGSASPTGPIVVQAPLTTGSA